MRSRCFKLFRAYSILFNTSNVGNFLLSWILEDCIKVQEKKKVVVLCPRLLQNVKLGISRRAVTSKKCTNKRDARAKLLRFCRFRWRRRRRCLKVMFNGTIRNDGFYAQHSAAMLEQCCNYSKQCRNNVATLCCAKNRRCESSRVTSP